MNAAIQQREQDVQKAIQDYLTIRGIFVFKVNNVGIYKKSTGKYIKSQMPGIPDIVGLLPGGRFIAVEVKRPGGKLSPHQKKFIEKVKEKGGIGIVAYSLLELIEKLKEVWG